METGNYTNPAFLSLQFNEADIAVGAFHPTVNTYNDFEGSIIYIMDKLAMVLPNVLTEETVWSRVKQIYSWKFFLVCLLCLSLILLIIYYFFNPTRMSFSTTAALQLHWFFQIIIESSIHRLHKFCNFRLVMISLLSFCLIHSTAFKNTLQMIYFNEKYSVSTTEENLNLYVPYPPPFAGSSTKPLNDSYTNLIRRVQVCTNVIKCLDRIAVFKDHEMLFLATPVIYSIPKYYVDKWTYQPLLVIDRIFQLMPIHMLVRKNYSAFQDINVVLRRLLENGIIQLEITKIRWTWHLQISKLKTKLKSRVLSVEHLEFIFLIWSLGLSLGISVFIVEIAVQYIRKNK
ncbi:uncharacterized protein [Euwallacea fornicatus]|uniref:uncharacterized protein n=1 Tax=Euwallacea fornicatus TaxID=995702 RepID=UPI00338E3C16